MLQPSFDGGRRVGAGAQTRVARAGPICPRKLCPFFKTALETIVSAAVSDEIAELRTKLKISDARFDDLKKSVDARSGVPNSTPAAEVVNLPNPLALAKGRRA